MKRISNIVVFAVSLFYLSANMAQASDGEQLFISKGCNGCHSLKGQGGDVGPALDGVGFKLQKPWLMRWLKNPAALKPDTQMPNLALNDSEVAMLTDFLLSQTSIVSHDAPQPGQKTFDPVSNPADNPDSIEHDFLDMGIDGGYLDRQRYTLQDQIQSFIPPIYQPVITQSAFVLPPGAMRFAVAYRQTDTMDASDIAGQALIGARFVHFDLQRQFLDFDYFLGLDNNMTFRVNVPVLTASLNQRFNPAFISHITAAPQGSYQELGDISLFLKKKFVDQGNFPVALAGVAAVRLPTGSDDELFDPNMLVTTPAGTSVVALPLINQDTGMPIMGSGDGTFHRFTDDGQLPAPLQPGLGTYGGSVGLFASRIFDNDSLFGRGAIHAGVLYEYRPDHDGVDPGNQSTLFARWSSLCIGISCNWISVISQKISKPTAMPV